MLVACLLSCCDEDCVVNLGFFFSMMLGSLELKICVHVSVFLCLDLRIACSTFCLPLSLGFCVFISGLLKLLIMKYQVII